MKVKDPRYSALLREEGARAEPWVDPGSDPVEVFPFGALIDLRHSLAGPPNLELPRLPNKILSAKKLVEVCSGVVEKNSTYRQIQTILQTCS